MNAEGECLAMGVLVDGVAEIEGKVERGARYNSIANYVLQRDGYIGIIVSEDRMIDVVAKGIENK